MSKQIIVPFGPQHPVLPEPIHLDLVLEDERVVDAIPSIGYIHRGFEKLVEKREYTEYVYIAERTCGICSFIHGATVLPGHRTDHEYRCARAGPVSAGDLVRGTQGCTPTSSGWGSLPIPSVLKTCS